MILLATSLYAQRQRQYIYLFDCTKSMIGYGDNPDIWQPTKDYLKSELEKHTPGTMLHVVPFQDKVLDAFSFDAEDLKWSDMEKKFDGYVQNVTHTNICDAWDATDNYIDHHKDNYIILLTDGNDNVKGMDALAKKLREWCGKHPNTYAFYVQLTNAAIDKRITDIIDICDNEHVIDATKGIPVFGAFENDIVIYANTLNLSKLHHLTFSAVGCYAASTFCADPYFDVEIVDGKIADGIVPIKIHARKPVQEINTAIPETYEFAFDVKVQDVDIINPTVRVVMTNKPERTLDIISEEQSMGKAKWYDRCLFVSESIPDTLCIDLNAVFNTEAKKDNSAVQMFVAEEENADDVCFFFNGQQLEDGKFILKANTDENAILSLVFRKDAKEGKRYFKIKICAKDNLDKINDKLVEQYEVTLRANYDVCWNPLKTFLVWMLIIIVALAILWMCLLKPMLVSKFKVGSIMISDPYFSTRRINGASRLVCTARQQKDSIFRCFFKGRTIYEINPIWNTDLVMIPGLKGGVKVAPNGGKYTIDPFASTLTKGEEYKILNSDTNEKVAITVM